MRITDFPELVTATGNDLLVTVDTANDLTKKIKLENLPTSIATTVALATKQNLLVSGTSIKTINSTTLLGSGDIALQPTLVSGTNIKTINSISLLGSGDITIAANPSGIAGAIQFSNGSAFASDAANLFWDDTNNRLGVGTNAPGVTLEVNGPIYANAAKTNTILGQGFITTPGTFWQIRQSTSNDISFDTFNGGTPLSALFLKQSGGSIGINTVTPTAQLHIKGSGSTSATTSLLVQNSAGLSSLQVTDDRIVKTFNGLDLSGNILYANGVGNASIFGGTSWLFDTVATGTFRFRNGSMALGASVADATAHLDVQSTTKGFLPPRMTTTQKNAIATPATGLVVYDNTTNKLCCYNGSTWNDLF